MSKERDIEFTPSPTLAGTDRAVEFNPAPGTGTTSTADSLRAQGSQAREQVEAKAEQATDRARQAAGGMVDRAAHQLTERLDQQKHHAAHSLSSVADGLRRSSSQFEGVPDGMTRYLGEAADRVDELAHYLHDREVEEIVGQVEDFARRQPAAFLGGAFALGLLGARFLKSSRRDLVRYEVRDRWDTERMTNRMYDPERDAVGRPQAPGYAPPQQRGETELNVTGRRDL